MTCCWSWKKSHAAGISVPNVMLVANSYLDQSGTHIVVHHTDPCHCEDAKNEDTLGLPSGWQPLCSLHQNQGAGKNEKKKKKTFNIFHVHRARLIVGGAAGVMLMWSLK